MTSEKTEGSIYTLVCECAPDSVRYIGQTVQGVQVRLKQHIHCAHKGHTGMPVLHWIRKHDKLGHTIFAQEIERCERSVLWERETYWICHFSGIGHSMLNACSPVSTPLGAERGRKISANSWWNRATPEDREKRLETFARGPRDPEVVQRIHDSRRATLAKRRAETGRVWSDETRERIGAGASEVWSRPGYREKMKSIPRPPLSEEHKAAIRAWNAGRNITPGMEEGMALGRHTRWHTNRGIVKEGCKFCENKP